MRAAATLLSTLAIAAPMAANLAFLFRSREKETAMLNPRCSAGGSEAPIFCLPGPGKVCPSAAAIPISNPRLLGSSGCRLRSSADNGSALAIASPLAARAFRSIPFDSCETAVVTAAASSSNAPKAPVSFDVFLSMSFTPSSCYDAARSRGPAKINTHIWSGPERGTQ